MDNDDRPIGRVLTRREILALLGTSAAALLVGCGPAQSGSTAPTDAATPAATGGTTATSMTSFEAATSTALATAPTLAPAATLAPATGTSTGALPACVVRPEQTEGPYFVDDQLDRSDIRSDPSDGTVKDGTPLQLIFRVSQVSSSGCAPLSGATVDIWHCDALGVYSDVADPGFNTIGKKFLRGYQTTDANGVAQFTTIYPGWYQGRTVHIHFKIRTTTAAGQSYDFTSQLYFDDTVTDTVHAQVPYASKGQRTLRNGGDGIYRNGGDQLLLTPTLAARGYAATFDIGLQLA